MRDTSPLLFQTILWNVTRTVVDLLSNEPLLTTEALIFWTLSIVSKALEELSALENRLLKSLARDGQERRFLQACVETGQPFVVDNTNPSRAERAVYIQAAKGAGFRVLGYYFQSKVEDCKRRNEQRPSDKQVPLRGILGTAGRMELPSLEEGFDELNYVRIEEAGGFRVEEWKGEV